MSQFTWGGLYRLFATALRTGVLRVPVAAAEGSVVLSVDAAGRVERVEERLALVGEFRAGRVRNKRVARDFLLLLTQRRPPGEDYVAWDERVTAELGLDRVPGMGPLDVDGLSDGQQDAVLEDVGALVAFATLVVLGFGVSVGALYLEQLGQQAALRAALEGAY